MVGQRTRNSLAGGTTATTNTTPVAEQSTLQDKLTPAQRAVIQAQINQLLILVQQLVVQLKKLKGL